MIFEPRGVCSQAIEFEIEDNKLKYLKFYGGCPGNLEGISKLAKNRNILDIIEDLEGIKCGSKTTSCPDQLAQALKQYLKKEIA